MANRYQAREVWLASAVSKLRPFFSSKGFEIPEKVRVSCGLPSSRAFGTTKRAIGEAWASTATRDKHFEIFISPTIDKAADVLPTLTHELVHVTVGLKCGHKGRFTECARAVGLVGPWTSTSASETLSARLNGLSEKLGKYPHGSLSKMTNGKKKQGTRMIKVFCKGCTYTIRTTMSWLMIGVPECPDPNCHKHGVPMHVDLPDGDETGDETEDDGAE